MHQTGVTKVGKYEVPVKNAKFLSIVSFDGGYRGRNENGEFAFWTAVLEKKRGRVRGVWGRARLILPPGERFSRMRGKEDYKDCWVDLLDRGKNVKFIRPSTLREIASWASSHIPDWKHATRISINGEHSKPRLPKGK